MKTLTTVVRQETFLGVYRAMRILGEGGMGQVFLGKHLKTGQEVVIKVMHDHLAQVPLVRQSFQRELQVMMQFRHPYAVSLLGGSIEGPGRPCLVMEFIRGMNLEEFQDRSGRFDAERVGYWLGQLCQVLHAAHSSNILHRDLSLANIMLVDGDTENESIKVMDFGLARLTNAFFIPLEKLKQEAVTNIGGGTPDYICPEQIRGEQVDQRGDLYSVGVMLYRLFTGRLPFQEATEVNDILNCHLKHKPPRFAERGVNDVPREVEQVVMQLLSKYPAERFNSARELALRYQQVLGQQIVPDTAFDEVPMVVNQTSRFNPDFVLDKLDAWMPEAIAIMKLRGFVDSVGGEIYASEPGLIRIRLARESRHQKAQKKGFLASLFASEPEPMVHEMLLDLYMEQKRVGHQSRVEIAAVLEPNSTWSQVDRADHREYATRLCRELRAFLMTGRST